MPVHFHLQGWMPCNQAVNIPTSIQKPSQSLWLVIGEHECKEVLSAKSCLVRCNVSYEFLSSFLKGNLDMIDLLQAFFDQIVCHAISTQRCPAIVPVKLGCVLCLDEIWHCHNLGLSWLGSCMGLDRISTCPCWDITSVKDYYTSNRMSESLSLNID